MEPHEKIIYGIYILLEKKRAYLNPFFNVKRFSKMLNSNTTDVTDVVYKEFGISIIELICLYRHQFWRKLVADIKIFFIILGYQKHEIS